MVLYEEHITGSKSNDGKGRVMLCQGNRTVGLEDSENLVT
jgi:hypothetical protein